MQEGISREYTISDSHPHAVEALLRYCYTGEFALSDKAVLHHVFKLAQMYEVANLRGEAAAAMMDGITTENVRERGRALKENGGEYLERFLDIVAKDRCLM